jgi:hypothetical protein
MKVQRTWQNQEALLCLQSPSHGFHMTCGAFSRSVDYAQSKVEVGERRRYKPDDSSRQCISSTFEDNGFHQWVHARGSKPWAGASIAVCAPDSSMLP